MMLTASPHASLPVSPVMTAGGLLTLIIVMVTFAVPVLVTLFGSLSLDSSRLIGRLRAFLPVATITYLSIILLYGGAFADDYLSLSLRGIGLNGLIAVSLYGLERMRLEIWYAQIRPTAEDDADDRDELWGEL